MPKPAAEGNIIPPPCMSHDMLVSSERTPVVVFHAMTAHGGSGRLPAAIVPRLTAADRTSLEPVIQSDTPGPIGPGMLRPQRSASVSHTSSGITFARFTSGPNVRTRNTLSW